MIQMNNIEFYNTPEGEVILRVSGEAERMLVETDTEFIDHFLQHIRVFYTKSYNILAEEYKTIRSARTYHFMMVRRFIKCNFGLYDSIPDIDEFGRFKFEIVPCPMRGECKYEKCLCCFPEYTTSLSDREIDVFKLVYLGFDDHQIANKLFISEHTVKNHKKNGFKKLNLHSTAEFVKYANDNQLFQQQ